MLKYLVQVTGQLLALMLMTGFIFSYIKLICGDKGKKFQYTAVTAGTLSALAMTFLKTTTAKIDTGKWNLRIYAVSIIVFILFLIFSAFRKKLKRTGEMLSAAMLTAHSAMLLLYFLTPFFENPHNMLLSEQTIFSTAFLYKAIGMLFGFLLTFLIGLALYKGAVRLEKNKVFTLLVIALLINTMRQISDSFSVMLAKRIIPSNRALFLIAKYASNYSIVFTYAILAVSLIIPAVLWLRSFKVNEPYDNPAEHRKIKAKWRNIRRWGVTGFVCAIFSVATLTVINDYANREVELSPIEEAKIDGGNVYVSFDKVDDGHLHRFGYTTEKGVTIRFIVIKKPNSSAYGIGLDACEICGETGYYEKDGQVVCNLCSVVMNINTIGFKGGCNPIVIDYSIKDGNIVVPIEGLMKNESIFK